MPSLRLFPGKSGQKYGRDSIPYRRVCDNAGALRQQDPREAERPAGKTGTPHSPVLLSVYFPNILDPFSLIPHSFWMMNHLTVDEAGFPNHQGPLDPQWLLVLVLDIADGYGVLCGVMNWTPMWNRT